MEEQLLRAERFLLAIAQRAQRACEALEKDDWEGFEEAMKWKNAAFHHFRAIDHIIGKEHPDYLKDQRWLDLWKLVRTSEKELTERIELYQSNLQKTLGKLRRSKVAHSRYQSGLKDDPGFLGEV